MEADYSNGGAPNLWLRKADIVRRLGVSPYRLKQIISIAKGEKDFEDLLPKREWRLDEEHFEFILSK